MFGFSAAESVTPPNTTTKAQNLDQKLMRPASTVAKLL